MLETHIICNVYIPTFNVLQTLILVTDLILKYYLLPKCSSNLKRKLISLT